MTADRSSRILSSDWGSAPRAACFSRRASGEETRDYLTQRAEDGREYAQRKARELRDRAGDLVERGKQVAKQSTESVSAAVDAGVDAYKREKSKAI